MNYGNIIRNKFPSVKENFSYKIKEVKLNNIILKMNVKSQYELVFFQKLLFII